jgi:hypothetical protein
MGLDPSAPTYDTSCYAPIMSGWDMCDVGGRGLGSLDEQ